MFWDLKNHISSANCVFCRRFWPECRKKARSAPNTNVEPPDMAKPDFLPLFGPFFAKVAFGIGIHDNYGEHLSDKNVIF
jgi:Asp-tRNA(Asn)/Glu-tRNA(Gln) amidotransferase B subunit